jgi:hypothetical protein
MMLRLQRERMEGSYVPSIREYFHFFGLDRQKLAYAKPDALVMHPGPMNRGIEVAAEVADGPLSVVTEQVTNGVAVRMAGVLERMVEIQCFTAEEKFKALLKRSPHILNLIPHKYIANYLCIDATNFSKLLVKIRI